MDEEDDGTAFLVCACPDSQQPSPRGCSKGPFWGCTGMPKLLGNWRNATVLN